MRRFLWFSFAALLVACVAVASSGGATQAKARWVIADLGTFGTDDIDAVAVNERGEIIGGGTTRDLDEWGRAGYVDHAFIWRKGIFRDIGPYYIWDINDHSQIAGRSRNFAVLWENGRIFKLGTLGGESSWAEAINNRGQVVGGSHTKRSQHAFLWQEGKMRDLGTLGKWSDATALNDAGQVVGVSETRAGKERAFLWQNGVMRDLGTLRNRSKDSYEAVAINESGVVVGMIDAIPQRWFVWENGRMSELGTLDLGDFRHQYFQAINNRGQIVGSGGTKSGATHAFLWEKGRMTDLGTLGGRESSANAINNRGQIVGSSSTKSGATHAFFWEKGRMTDLGTLGGKRSGATALNEQSQVIGYSDAKNGKRHAVLWTLKR